MFKMEVSLREHAVSFALDIYRGRMPGAAELVDEAAVIESYLRDGKPDGFNSSDFKWVVDTADNNLVAKMKKRVVAAKRAAARRPAARKTAR